MFTLIVTLLVMDVDSEVSRVPNFGTLQECRMAAAIIVNVTARDIRAKNALLIVECKKEVEV